MRKYPINTAQYSLYLSVILFALNYPAIARLFSHMDGGSHIGFSISILFGFYLIGYLYTELLIWGEKTKWFLGFVLILHASLAYLLFNFKTVFDKTMLESLLHSDAREASEYLSLIVIAQLLGYIALAALFCRFFEIDNSPLKYRFRQKLITVFAILFLFTANLGLYFKDYAFFLRQNKDIKYVLMPVNYISAAFGLAKGKFNSNKFEDWSQTAKLKTRHLKNKTVYIVVIGETARSQNFSLFGYERPTNPYLKKQKNLVAWGNVESCGTSTAVSVPCLFDPVGSNNHKSFNHSNLLDLAKKVGLKTSWLENNTGCQGVCDRIGSVSESKGPFCIDGTCYDESLIPLLDKTIAETREPLQLVVLHTLGSHGPKYFKRYPEKFDLFTPDCRSADLQNCSREEIINSYDNTILYTDFFLHQLIEYASKLKDINVSMIYVSDHGESLGEKGLYLHAIPKSFAPNEQTRVPLVFWSNASFIEELKIDIPCLAKNQIQKLSHDNFFHSVSGLMGVESQFYDGQLDIFKNCMDDGSKFTN